MSISAGIGAKVNYNEEHGQGGAQAVEAADTPDQTQAERGEGVASSKSTKSPAFQFYPKDFLSSGKVQRMSMTERGVYITLLSHCWLDNGLPVELAKLAGIVKLPEKRFTKMWRGALSECFIDRKSRLHNDRLDNERRKQVEFQRRQSDNGKLGGRPKKGLGSSGLEVDNPLETQDEAKKSSSLSSSSSSPKERTHTQGPTRLVSTAHKFHASCGRTCVPADLHEGFIRALNRDDAEKLLSDFYKAVDNEWSVGAMKDENPGGNDYRFWRARFSEKWPAKPSAQAAAIEHPRSRTVGNAAAIRRFVENS